MVTLDPTDVRLLTELQKNAQFTSHQLGDKLGLSASQAGRRRQRLEELGFIQAYIARLDPDKLGLSVQSFIQIHLSRHQPETADSFERLIKTRAEITNAWTLTGEADYLLRVYCDSLSTLNSLIQNVLLPHTSVARVHSQIVMDHLKRDAALPI